MKCTDTGKDERLLRAGRAEGTAKAGDGVGEGTAPGYSMISSVCSFLFSLILGNPFPFLGAQLRRKGILTFLAQISTSRGGRFLVLPRRTPDAEQVNLLLRAWRSTEATTLRGPERLTDRAAKPAEGGPGAAGTLRGAAGDPGAAQCGARLRPAAPFFHPLPLPTPTARSILSLPSPRLHQSRPAEGLPPGRGTRGRALPPPWASRHSGAPGPSGSSLSPCSQRRLTAGWKPLGSSGTRCRKLVRHSDCRAETGVAILPAPVVRLQRGVGRGHRGAGLRCRRRGPGAPGPAFGPAPPPRAGVVG